MCASWLLYFAASIIQMSLRMLPRRLDQLTAQVQQLNDRARERAISLAQALRAAGGGDLEPIEQVQLQQDDQLEVRHHLSAAI